MTPQLGVSESTMRVRHAAPCVLPRPGSGWHPVPALCTKSCVVLRCLTVSTPVRSNISWHAFASTLRIVLRFSPKSSRMAPIAPIPSQMPFAALFNSTRLPRRWRYTCLGLRTSNGESPRCAGCALHCKTSVRQHPQPNCAKVPRPYLEEASIPLSGAMPAPIRYLEAALGTFGRGGNPLGQHPSRHRHLRAILRHIVDDGNFPSGLAGLIPNLGPPDRDSPAPCFVLGSLSLTSLHSRLSEKRPRTLRNTLPHEPAPPFS